MVKEMSQREYKPDDKVITIFKLFMVKTDWTAKEIYENLTKKGLDVFTHVYDIAIVSFRSESNYKYFFTFDSTKPDAKLTEVEYVANKVNNWMIEENSNRQVIWRRLI